MNESKPYYGLLGLDILPAWAKIIIWLVSFAWVAIASISAADPAYYKSLEYIIDPAVAIVCFAGAGLRLAGIRWVYIFIFWLAMGMLLSIILPMLFVSSYIASD